jgi:hypothetical protein
VNPEVRNPGAFQGLLECKREGAITYREQAVVSRRASALVQYRFASGLVQRDGFDPLSLLLPNDDYSTLQVYVWFRLRLAFRSSKAGIQAKRI